MMKTSIKSEQTNGQRKLKTEYSLVYGIFTLKKSAVYLFHLKNVRPTDIQTYILNYRVALPRKIRRQILVSAMNVLSIDVYPRLLSSPVLGTFFICF